jgi:endonuclease I
MRKTLLLLFVLISTAMYSQIVVSNENLQFPQIVTGTTSSLNVVVKNNHPYGLTFSLEKNSTQVFRVADTLFTIQPGDSIVLSFSYSPVQNIIDEDLFPFLSSDSSEAFVVKVSGSGKHENNYYQSTFNLYDNELKTALTSLTNNHTQLGYNTARDRMFDTVDKLPGDTIECIYSGRKIKAANRTQAQNQSFNTEHTWPQSLFNENEPMKSDLNHLYPTDANANNVRANYLFGDVVSGVTWSEGGSKLGRNSLNQTVFEVRDKNKGNTARAVLYFLIRYPQNYGFFVNAYEESVMRDWSQRDPVDAIEINRNNYIQNYQQKRNPFIDHPEFIDRIYSFYSNAVKPVSPLIEVYPKILVFDSTNVADTSYNFLNVLNPGTSTLKIDSVVFNNNQFSLSLQIDSVQKKTNGRINIAFIPNTVGSTSSVLSIYTNAGEKSVVIEGSGREPSDISGSQILNNLSFELEQNYPNPFNPVTTIRFSVPESGKEFLSTSLRVYDILGNEVAVLVNEDKTAGTYTIEFNPAGLSSGIYFYQLKCGNLISTKKMILIR